MLPISSPDSPETAANFLPQTAKGAEQIAPRPEKSSMATDCPSTKPTRLADGLGLWKYPTRRMQTFKSALHDAPLSRAYRRDVGSPVLPVSRFNAFGGGQLRQTSFQRADTTPARQTKQGTREEAVGRSKRQEQQEASKGRLPPQSQNPITPPDVNIPQLTNPTLKLHTVNEWSGWLSADDLPTDPKPLCLLRDSL